MRPAGRLPRSTLRNWRSRNERKAESGKRKNVKSRPVAALINDQEKEEPDAEIESCLKGQKRVAQCKHLAAGVSRRNCRGGGHGHRSPPRAGRRGVCSTEREDHAGRDRRGRAGYPEHDPLPAVSRGPGRRRLRREPRERRLPVMELEPGQRDPACGARAGAPRDRRGLCPAERRWQIPGLPGLCRLSRVAREGRRRRRDGGHARSLPRDDHAGRDRAGQARLLREAADVFGLRGAAGRRGGPARQGGHPVGQPGAGVGRRPSRPRVHPRGRNRPGSRGENPLGRRVLGGTGMGRTAAGDPAGSQRAGLGPLARAGAGAALPSRVSSLAVARLVGFRHRPDRRHGMPQVVDGVQSAQTGPPDKRRGEVRRSERGNLSPPLRDPL